MDFFWNHTLQCYCNSVGIFISLYLLTQFTRNTKIKARRLFYDIEGHDGNLNQKRPELAVLAKMLQDLKSLSVNFDSTENGGYHTLCAQSTVDDYGSLRRCYTRQCFLQLVSQFCCNTNCRQTLPSVTYPAMDMSRTFFVATDVVRSWTRFYFLQRLRQCGDNFFEHCPL